MRLLSEPKCTATGYRYDWSVSGELNNNELGVVVATLYDELCVLVSDTGVIGWIWNKLVVHALLEHMAL
jgi:hypothetical protein